MGKTMNVNEAATTPIDEDEADTGRRMDDELKVMGAIIRLLNNVDEPAQSRIVNYIASRFAK